MGQGVEAVDKLAHNAQDAPGIGNGKIKVQRALKCPVISARLLAGYWLGWTDQGEGGTAQQPPVLGIAPPFARSERYRSAAFLLRLFMPFLVWFRLILLLFSSRIRGSNF